MLIVGGFNGYPAEIEGFLLEHPAVAQADVIGLPDDGLGQLGKAYVGLADPAVADPAGAAPVTPEDLITWSRTRMAGYKVPRTVQFLDTLPLSATGKVMKDHLR